MGKKKELKNQIELLRQEKESMECTLRTVEYKCRMLEIKNEELENSVKLLKERRDGGVDDWIKRCYATMNQGRIRPHF